MADTASNEGRASRIRNQIAAYALANLFLYSVAMFTIPFVAFFGVRHLLTEEYPVDTFTRNVWSVIAAVVAVNLIICAYAFKAYHEKEYDDEGNEITKFSYESPTDGDKSSLNLKQD